MLNGLSRKTFSFKTFNKFLYLTVGIACIIYASSLIAGQDDYLDITRNYISENLLLIIFAVCLYLSSHGLRVMRLALLSPNPNLKIAVLFKEQYKANGVNLLIPFKLGEAYRLIYFKDFFGSYANSFAVLICERLLDLIVIFLILVVTIYFSDLNISTIQNIFQISILLLFIALIIFYALVELLQVISKILFLREASTRNVNIIEKLSYIERAIKRVKFIFKEKVLACIFITFAIWMLEIMVFFMFYDYLNQRLDIMILLSIAVSFSALLPNGPLGYGGLQIAFYYVGVAFEIERLIDLSFTYGFCIFGSGLLFAGILFLFDFFYLKKDRF